MHHLLLSSFCGTGVKLEILRNLICTYHYIFCLSECRKPISWGPWKRQFQKFLGAAPLDPPGGLTAPDPQLFSDGPSGRQSTAARPNFTNQAHYQVAPLPQICARYKFLPQPGPVYYNYKVLSTRKKRLYKRQKGPPPNTCRRQNSTYSTKIRHLNDSEVVKSVEWSRMLSNLS